MGDKVKRTTTKYKSIYFNENTKKYDIKYNFKEYDPLTQKNKYRAKWIYNLQTLSEAKTELAKLQSGQAVVEDKDITLAGIYNVWKLEAKANGFSVITERNTEQQMNMIYQFIPADTKLKNITGDIYTYLISKCRDKKYSEETLHNINACFRKMMNLAWTKEYISENPLKKVQNKKFKVKKPLEESSPHLITKTEFKALDDYFNNNSFVRLGYDRYIGYRLMINFLYCTGMRIGELLALQFKDIEPVVYKNGSKVEEIIVDEYDPKGFAGFQVQVNKVYLGNGAIDRYPKRIRNETKNKKNRIIPLSTSTSLLYADYQVDCYQRGGKATDRVFPWTQGNALYMVTKACKRVEIKHHNLHDFRHTFISNLLDSGLSLAQVELFSGDEQGTILRRYSHANSQSKIDLVNVLDSLQL